MDDFYPPLPNEQYCRQCRLRKVACYCRHVPTILTPIQFVLVYHPKELGRLNNTGQLISRAITNTQKIVWQRKQHFEFDSEVKTLLVYPGDLASRYQGVEHVSHPVEILPKISLKPALSSADEITIRLILIDATWQEAQKIYCQSPELQNLSLLDLSAYEGVDDTLYDLRRNQRGGGISTVQTAEACLRASGDIESADALKKYFLRFLLHSKASASNHAVLSEFRQDQDQGKA